MEDLEKVFKQLFKNIMDKNSEKYKEIIKEIIPIIEERKYNNPKSFNYNIIQKFNNISKELLKEMDLENDVIDIHKYTFVFLNYSFLEKNIRELCILREGNSCCADKSSSLIKMYLKYTIKGEIPPFDPNKEIWYMPNFGTNQEWINFINGLYKLYYGQPTEYLKSYMVLIQSKKRKFKHILHTWYLKFNDDTTIKLSQQWDENDNNPLDNDIYDKEDYYLIDKSLLSDKIYETYTTEEEIDHGFLFPHCIVPKKDIKSIYKESKELLI